jgi:hypothetical protein
MFEIPENQSIKIKRMERKKLKPKIPTKATTASD